MMPKGILNICRAFLRENDKYLSPNHYYFTDVKFALCQLIGQDSGLQTVSDEDVEFKAKLCRQLIDMMKILIPGKLNFFFNLISTYSKFNVYSS